MREDRKTELHVYDFDKTLFRSPPAPAVWKGDWWREAESLSHPYVPEVPDSSWWIEKTVAHARESIRRPNTVTVLLTGRTERSSFRYRIPELLRQKGLDFDHVFLRDPDFRTPAFKKVKIIAMLMKYPDIQHVMMFDDAMAYLREYKKLFEHLNEKYSSPKSWKLNWVHEKEKGVLWEPESYPTPALVHPKAAYWGIFLTSQAKADLDTLYPSLYDTRDAEHVTLGTFDKKNMPTEQIRQLLGKRVSVVLGEYKRAADIEAVEVSLPAGLRSVSGIPHITLSREKNVAPVMSQQLLKGIYPAEHVDKKHLILEGIIDTRPSSLLT